MYRLWHCPHWGSQNVSPVGKEMTATQAMALKNREASPTFTSP